MRLPVLCLCFGVLLHGATPADSSPMAVLDDLVSGLLTKWRIPAASLAVSHDGRLTLKREYGTPQTVTAGETLRQVETGELSLDNPQLPRNVDTGDPRLVGKKFRGANTYLRQASLKLDTALVFDSLPADIRLFEADLSAEVSSAARSIQKWPPIDLFVDGPELRARDVVNAADYRGGGVAPSEIVILFPANAGPPEMVAWGSDTTHKSRYSINSLGATRVLFDGVAAPMVYAVSGQICAIVPYAVSGRKTTELVLEYQGRRSAPVTLPVVSSAPALFTLDASGLGPAAMLNETGCCNSVRNPAVRGTVASLYATGEGLPLPGASGSVKVRAAELGVKVTLGGVPADIEWVGNVGVLQVNFRVPANAPVGDAVPLVLTVGNARSSAAVTMAVRSARQQILLVSGELASRRRLTGILSAAGYDVFTAQAGKDAAEQANLHNVDLVISDLAMPSKEGSDMMRLIRNAHPQLKLAGLCTALSPDSLRAADLLGAQTVLTKSLAAPVVLQRVGVLLQRRPATY